MKRFLVAMVLGALCASCKTDAPTGPAPSPSAEPLAAASASAPPLASAATADAEAVADASPSEQGATAADADDAGTTGDAGTSSKKRAAKNDRVKLLEPGKEPLAKLRYKFVPKQLDRLDMTTTSELSMQVAGKTVPAPGAPGVQVIAALEVLSVDANGTAERRLGFESLKLLSSPGLPADIRDRAEKNLKNIEKISGKDRVDARGFVHAVKLDASKIEDPQLRQALSAMQQTFDQLGAPFPEEEIGIGAKWQVRTRAEQMGINLEQTATYELIALEGSTGKLAIKLQQRAPGGKMALPGLPAGASAKLLGMKGTGKGELGFDLGRGVPDGHIDTNTEVKVAVTMNADQQEMVTKLKAKVRFKPLAAK